MHQKDPDVSRYLIGAISDMRRDQGHHVEALHGLSQPIRGDILSVHVDLTVVPPEYLRAMADHPYVVNRRVVNISKWSRGSGSRSARRWSPGAELEFDYGKSDYVVCEGKVVPLDANRTPGFPRDRERRCVAAEMLAPGLGSLLA